MIKPFRKFTSYFIHSDGYIFQIVNGKEIFPSIRLNKKGKPTVIIDGVVYLLIDEMCRHFIDSFPSNAKLAYTITKEGRVPLKSMRAVVVQKEETTEEETQLMIAYKCAQKAASANNRSKDLITQLQVYLCLKYNDFRCAFCGEHLTPIKWHLDHFQPLSRGGKNSFENLEPSCETCNIMKGALQGAQFYKRCKLIAEKYIYKESAENGSEKNQKKTKNVSTTLKLKI